VNPYNGIQREMRHENDLELAFAYCTRQARFNKALNGFTRLFSTVKPIGIVMEGEKKPY